VIVINESNEVPTRYQVAHLSTRVCYTDITTRIPLLGQLAGKEFVEFGTENTISDELSLFADLRGHVLGNRKLNITLRSVLIYRWNLAKKCDTLELSGGDGVEVNNPGIGRSGGLTTAQLATQRAD